MDSNGDDEDNGAFEGEIATREVVPWESDEPPADPPGQRHDAFNGLRKRAFLKTLAKTGCVRDGARAAGVSTQTVYTHQSDDPEFARHCDLALQMAATDLELMAWERAVIGVEEERFYAGKLVGTRVRRSDAILRLLLQGANRKKFGPNPGFSRKRLLAVERKQIRRELEAEQLARMRNPEEVTASILKKLSAFDAHFSEERFEAGWTRLEDGSWIPPGWVKLGDTGAAEGEAPPGGSKKGNSV